MAKQDPDIPSLDDLAAESDDPDFEFAEDAAPETDALAVLTAERDDFRDRFMRAVAE